MPSLTGHRLPLGSVVLACLVLIVSAWGSSCCAADPAIAPVDRIRLAESFRLNKVLGEKCWPGWKSTPEAVILVYDSVEFLIRHPAPSTEFELLGFDSDLGSNVHWRPRTFPTNLLATFPAVGGVVSIVIGRAEATASRTSTPWVVTLAHEHFHQWQMSQTWYARAVDSLDLSGGDKTGMWMLNYDFPYDSEGIATEFSALQRELIGMLETRKPDSLRARLKSYLSNRERFLRAVGEGPARYFSFQVWQEGIARYVEARVAQLAAKKLKSSSAFRTLTDYEPFDSVAERVRKTIINELSTLKLNSDRRVCFYAYGAAEGMVLDRLLPNWPVLYAQQRFRLERLLEIGLKSK